MPFAVGDIGFANVPSVPANDTRVPSGIVPPADVSAFVADLGSHRDRAMALAMVLGGLRAAEVRSLRLADVDMGMRRLRVMGKGRRERVVPVDRVVRVRTGDRDEAAL